MNERQLFWWEAEAIFPGIKAEWKEMNADRRLGYRLGPHLLAPNVEEVEGAPVEVWLVRWPQKSGPDVKFIEIRADAEVLYPCDEGKMIEWEIRPYWRRWSDGSWNCPLPLPKSLTPQSRERLMLEYRYSLEKTEPVLCKRCGSPVGGKTGCYCHSQDD